MKIWFQGSLIFEEIFEEYVNDIFEFLDSIVMLVYFIFVWSDLLFKWDIFFVIS